MTIELANRLQKLRKEHGYTQESLADALGVSRQAVSKWECTEASPDTDNLIALARLYGMSLDDIVNGKPEEYTDTAEESANTFDEAKGNDSSDKNDEQAGGGAAGGEDKDKSSGIHININGAHTDDGDDDDDDDDDDFHGKVDIGLNGIHVEDEDGTTVHIGLDGIHVKDGGGKTVFTGNNMDADESGVHISSDDGTEVHIGGNHIYVNGKDVCKEHFKTGKIVGAVAGVTVILCVAAYILLGVLLDLWHPAWIIFLAIPVIPSLLDAILKRNAAKFAFPVFVTAIYLILGCVFGYWHPCWVVFFTIPVYYIVVDLIRKK